MRILPLRLLLVAREPLPATIPMLRGRWGEALKWLDEQVYTQVFRPDEGASGGETPLYLLRPAPPDPGFAPAFDCLLYDGAIEARETLLRAWDIAGGIGVGDPCVRFVVARRCGIGPDGSMLDEPAAWSLDRAAWPLPGPPATTPCQLCFPAPLRIVRKNRQTGRDELIREPDLPLLVDAALKRCALFGLSVSAEERMALLDAAREFPAQSLGWEPADLVVLSPGLHRKPDRRGVIGGLALPAGPGPLWRLFAQAQWLHLGKGTVHGLGQLVIHAG